MLKGRILAACMMLAGLAAEAAPAFSMPAAPAKPAVATGDVTLAQWGPPPPPGWGPPPRRDWERRPPPPPGWGPPPRRDWDRRPPPPPGWRHPPPRGWGHRPPPPPRYYRPAPPPPPYYGPRALGRAHVNWCLNRYRSYNPATNRYLSSSGYYRICVSPYSR